MPENFHNSPCAHMNKSIFISKLVRATNYPFELIFDRVIILELVRENFERFFTVHLSHIIISAP